MRHTILKLSLALPLAISMIGMMGLTYKGFQMALVEAKAMASQEVIRPLTSEENFKLWLYEKTGFDIKLFKKVYKLEQCESQHTSWAINPKDRDGTPSYGAFQFKPTTLLYYAKKYGYEINPEPNEILNLAFDRYFTAEIVIKMFQDKSVNLNREFPVCIKKI